MLLRVKKMKVIFLDIDGVVCLHKDKKNWDNDEEVFDEDCCKRLKEIMQATGSKLVLSSSWRLFPESIEYVFDQFEPYGITPKDFIGITPLLGERGAEILQYLESRRDIDSFIALDDEMYDCESFPYYRLILTETHSGITEVIRDLCIERLQGDQEKYESSVFRY